MVGPVSGVSSVPIFGELIGGCPGTVGFGEFGLVEFEVVATVGRGIVQDVVVGGKGSGCFGGGGMGGGGGGGVGGGGGGGCGFSFAFAGGFVAAVLAHEFVEIHCVRAVGWWGVVHEGKL